MKHNSFQFLILLKKIFFLFLIYPLTLPAQIDTTRKEFYPLQIGNLWQYRNEFNDLVFQQVIGDTILDGIKYYLLIHSLRTTGGMMRIDSLMRVQNRRGGPTAGDSCGGNTPYELSIYHLAEPDSTAWKICSSFNGIPAVPLVRFNNITVMNIFGQLREVMNFDYGAAPSNEDTIWNFGASLAKGIGILGERYFEGEYFSLQGAIINSIQYGTIVSTDEILETIPSEIKLYQNYPNPFNPVTKIRYEINKISDVLLKVVNIIGEEIEVLVDEIKTPGSYEIEFNGKDLSSGVYIALLQTAETQLTKCMLLIK